MVIQLQRRSGKAIDLQFLISQFLIIHKIHKSTGRLPTIQNAIDVANNVDIILVDEGTYYENINFKGKAITVASKFILDQDTSHISRTIINGSQPSNPNNASVVTFNSGEDTTSVICGFTITGGKGTVYIDNSLIVQEEELLL